jgi:hypothetical protein
MRRFVPVLLSLAVVFAGCKAKEAIEKADIARDLQKRGTTDLLKETAKDKYDAPADGRLTDAQVQMYLKVRDHEKQIAQVAKAEAQKHADAAKKDGEHSISGMMEGLKTMSAAAEMMTADIRAAKDLGYNTAEYQWVKGKILDASISAMQDKTTQAVNAQMDAAYTQTKKAYDEAKDEQTKAMYKQMLDSYAQSKTEMAKDAQKNDKPELAYNRQLLSKYENALNAFTNEVAKFEDKPGDAQKQMQDWQKGVDKAKEDAAKH